MIFKKLNFKIMKKSKMKPYYLLVEAKSPFLEGSILYASENPEELWEEKRIYTNMLMVDNIHYRFNKKINQYERVWPNKYYSLIDIRRDNIFHNDKGHPVMYKVFQDLKFSEFNTAIKQVNRNFKLEFNMDVDHMNYYIELNKRGSSMYIPKLKQLIKGKFKFLEITESLIDRSKLKFCFSLTKRGVRTIEI